ncbi:WD40-repeat-containing domain protein [Mariannaea sp. PMI_226]|nr:WD40-repeat-containing domain protein [Mariannaea sp. PMI_226]
MGRRWLDKVKDKAKRLRQADSQEPASAPIQQTPSSDSTLAASDPAIQPKSQPIPSPPTPKEVEPSFLPSLQERLWNQAYDDLKESETKLIKAYETILSAELDRNGSNPAASESTEYEIGSTRETRCRQMQQLVQGGLERTQKQASIKQSFDDGLQAIQAVRGIVDKAVQASPEAAVAWVGVCFGLELISNPVTEARENRKGIIYVLSRMDWYWNLVSLLLDESRAEQSSAGLRVQLEKHIVQLYQKILAYQVKSVCLYHRKWAAVIGRDMFKIDDWAGQLNDIMEAEASVQRDMEQYNTEESKIQLRKLTDTACALEMNLKDIHSAIQDQTRQQREWHQDDKDKQCLKDLRETDPRDDKTRIQDTKGGLLRDSYRWILHHDDFQRWRNDPQSQLLWITGDPGKGKTMLLCGVLDELEKEHGTSLSYFLCQATEARLSNATAVLRGLIYLLVEKQPSLISYVREKYDHAGKQAFEDGNAWEVLSKILTAMLDDPRLHGAILVVDGIDECRTNRNQLLDFITRTSRVKWIVSSRNWPDIEERLHSVKQKTRLHLEQNKESVSAAVRIYIQHKLAALVEQKKYDDETRDIVERHLVSSANDTFLWVALVCQELQTTDVWDVPDVIDKMPAGLEALYDRMLRHIQSLERRNPEMCRQVLSTVAVAFRPLRLEELGRLSGLPASIQRSSDHISKIISMCGSFLTIKDKVVYIIHQTARDFLFLSPFIFSSDVASGIANQHNALISRSLGAMSEILRCDIYRINAPGCSIEQVLPPDPDPLAPIRYSCVHWVDHLDNLNNTQNITDKKDLQDGGIVHEFIRNKYLYWLESLSLLRSMSDGVMAVQKLGALVVYASALVFSPEQSLIRQRFMKEEPSWMMLKPKMEMNWNACLQTLEGHDHSVMSVTVSPDGQRIASGSGDRTVRVWDAATGESQQTLEGHSSWVTSVAFSPDGLWIASGSGDRTIRIWDSATGQCQQTLEGHSGSIMSIAFSADSQQIISGSDDGMIKIWNATMGVQEQTLEGHSHWVTSVAFSPDGRRLASGSGDRTVKIWDAITGKHQQTLQGHSRWVRSIAFSANNNQQIVSGSDDNTIWDAITNEHQQNIKSQSRPVMLFAVSADGQRIASGSDNHVVKIWDVETGDCQQTLEDNSRSITSIMFSADGQRIVLGSDDNTIRIWDTRTGECQQTLKGHGHWQIASASEDSTLKIWDAVSGGCQQTLEVGRVLAHVSFDPTSSSSLFTDIGLLKLDTSSATNKQSPEAASGSLIHSGCGISDDGMWIIKDGSNMLWLPPEYRAAVSVVMESTVAIGCRSGRVLVMRLS